ncbi:MAG: N-acyl homoserine lactonase family protein, partial [Gemmatimonadota bacterium]
ARTARPGYFPRWHPYFRLAVREEVTAGQEIGPAMKTLGLSTSDVRWVVMTHLHTDHAGGLHHFPAAEILVSATEYRLARGTLGKLRGYLPQHWPAWFRPRLINVTADATGLDGGRPLTAVGDVRIVATPGHTAGHVSVLVEEDRRALLFAGDTSYTEANLVSGIVDGVASLGGGQAAAARTLRQIRQYASSTPTVYLPSHDPGAAERLTARREVVQFPRAGKNRIPQMATMPACRGTLARTPDSRRSTCEREG